MLEVRDLGSFLVHKLHDNVYKAKKKFTPAIVVVVGPKKLAHQRVKEEGETNSSAARKKRPPTAGSSSSSLSFGARVIERPLFAFLSMVVFRRLLAAFNCAPRNTKLHGAPPLFSPFVAPAKKKSVVVLFESKRQNSFLSVRRDVQGKRARVRKTTKIWTQIVKNPP